VFILGVWEQQENYFLTAFVHFVATVITITVPWDFY